MLLCAEGVGKNIHNLIFFSTKPSEIYDPVNHLFYLVHNALKAGDSVAIYSVSMGYTRVIFSNISVAECSFDLLASIKLGIL